MWQLGEMVPGPLSGLLRPMSVYRGKTVSPAKVRRIRGRPKAGLKEHLAKKASPAEAGIAPRPKWPVDCQKPRETTLGSRAGFAELRAHGGSTGMKEARVEGGLGLPHRVQCQRWAVSFLLQSPEGASIWKRWKETSQEGRGGPGMHPSLPRW